MVSGTNREHANIAPREDYEAPANGFSRPKAPRQAFNHQSHVGLQVIALIYSVCLAYRDATV